MKARYWEKNLLFFIDFSMEWATIEVGETLTIDHELVHIFSVWCVVFFCLIYKWKYIHNMMPSKFIDIVIVGGAQEKMGIFCTFWLSEIQMRQSFRLDRVFLKNAQIHAWATEVCLLRELWKGGRGNGFLAHGGIIFFSAQIVVVFSCDVSFKNGRIIRFNMHTFLYPFIIVASENIIKEGKLKRVR